MAEQKTLKECLETVAQREHVVVKPHDTLWWLIGVYYRELSPLQAIALLERAGIAHKPAYIQEAHTISFPEYGKEETVAEQIIALSPASREVPRAEQFALFTIYEGKRTEGR